MRKLRIRHTLGIGLFGGSAAAPRRNSFPHSQKMDFGWPPQNLDLSQQPTTKQTSQWLVQVSSKHASWLVEAVYSAVMLKVENKTKLFCFPCEADIDELIAMQMGLPFARSHSQHLALIWAACRLVCHPAAWQTLIIATLIVILQDTIIVKDIITYNK